MQSLQIIVLGSALGNGSLRVVHGSNTKRELLPFERNNALMFPPGMPVQTIKAVFD